MASAFSLQASKDFLCPGCHHLTSLFPQCFFCPLPGNRERAGNVSGKWVKILIVPCSCVWVVREIRELLLRRGLFGLAINQSSSSSTIQETPRAHYRSPIDVPSSPCPAPSSLPTPAHSCSSLQASTRGRKGEGRGIAFSCSVLPELPEDCAWVSLQGRE